MNETLRDALLEMARLDRMVRTEFAASGELFEGGYEPRMARVHERNARRLLRIIESVGWPGTDLVGPDGADAAWIVLQHAIAEPDLLRRALPLLQAAAKERRVPARRCWRPDPILRGTGRVRLGPEGNLSPGEVEDPQRLDERLPPLAEQMEEARTRATSEGDRPPADHQAYARARDEWAASVGWRAD
ncbi:hypothetical protein [Candidatus Palauibacter sp.]|uniref:hypothetical protein n=1 Tax=Candidatus Palauibacter sp. TaxID=3101350 RepID=UPI003AF230EF